MLKCLTALEATFSLLASIWLLLAYTPSLNCILRLIDDGFDICKGRAVISRNWLRMTGER